MLGNTMTAARTTPKRAAKREALLAETARQINDRGAGAVALNDIADAVGLSRNGLYYYVADRADAVFQCYEQSCALMGADIAAASAAAPVAAIETLIERVLDPERPDCAVVTDVDFLDDEHRAIIRASLAGNVATLRATLERGIKANIFRPHDSEVAAQSILGMLSWALLSPRWLMRRDGLAARRALAETLKVMILDGLVKPGCAAAPLSLNADAVFADQLNPFDREQASLLKTRQLVAAASRLFNRQGIDGTALNEIGVEAGATKGAIYHYFRDKTDLVVRCYDRALEVHGKLNEVSRAAGKDAVTQIAAHLLLSCQAQAGPLSPLMMQAGFLSLPEDAQARVRAGTTKFRNEWSRRLRQGVAEGSCRALDATHASIAHAGMYMWLAKWLQPKAQFDLARLSAEMVQFGMYGLLKRPR